MVNMVEFMQPRIYERTSTIQCIVMLYRGSSLRSIDYSSDSTLNYRTSLFLDLPPVHTFSLNLPFLFCSLAFHSPSSWSQFLPQSCGIGRIYLATQPPPPPPPPLPSIKNISYLTPLLSPPPLLVPLSPPPPWPLVLFFSPPPPPPPPA